MGAGTVLVLALMREGRAHTLKAELLQAQSRALNTHDVHALILGRAQTGLQAFF